MPKIKTNSGAKNQEKTCFPQPHSYKEDKKAET